MSYSDLLNGAYDMHVHSLPDVIYRSQDPWALLKEAQKTRMAGIVLKDHTTSTVGRVFALNKQRINEFKYYIQNRLTRNNSDMIFRLRRIAAY